MAGFIPHEQAHAWPLPDILKNATFFLTFAFIKEEEGIMLNLDRIKLPCMTAKARNILTIAADIHRSTCDQRNCWYQTPCKNPPCKTTVTMTKPRVIDSLRDFFEYMCLIVQQDM